MGYSLYYEAHRDTQLTRQEARRIAEIVDTYCAQYPFQKKVENFTVYDSSGEEGNCIFSGATKLPNTLHALYDAANYWMQCLTEIAALLRGAQWNASFDDVPLVLDPKEGWRFMTDEEYKNRKR